MAPKQQKLYAYVDESGQDPKSDSFVVVAIVSEDEQISLRKELLTIETISGIGYRKWHKASYDKKIKFLDLIQSRSIAHKGVFYGSYKKPLPYFLPILNVLTYAIKAKIKTSYKLRIYVDGIDSKKAKELTNALRIEGISTTLVKSKRDESEPLIRLADRWAGLIRSAKLGNKDAQIILKSAEKKNHIVLVEPKSPL